VKVASLPICSVADSATFGDPLAVTPDVANDHSAIAAKAGRLAMPPAPIAVVTVIVSGVDVHTASSDINIYALRTR